ncbi:HlyU family transcriptional regulator [Arvimicrobium flavum]|uniref:HlyU family transcriptional regulator n=1 Tax=Arvimicrobium flavum TaxID=3393320 RepID=UPI00237A09BB|nr:HlyU family transcriptional regulator [Mesorhizobium shangrilense]
MSFLKRLFGLGGDASEGEGASTGGKVAKEVEHKGFVVRATPFKEGGQFQTCGTVSKEVGGVVKEHRFVRADRFAGLEDAVEVSIRKGIQLIDEQGERLFN